MKLLLFFAHSFSYETASKSLPSVPDVKKKNPNKGITKRIKKIVSENKLTESEKYEIGRASCRERV